MQTWISCKFCNQLCIQIQQIKRRESSKTMKINMQDYYKPFISIRKHQSLVYYVNLHPFVESGRRIKEVLKRCKYCKAYVFSVNIDKDNKVGGRVCEMCKSINDYEMVHHVLEKPRPMDSYEDNSYIIESISKSEKVVYLNLFIDVSLDEDYLSNALQAIKSLLPCLLIKVIVLIPMGNGLGLIDFRGSNSGDLIILSEDVSANLILEYALLLKEEHINWLIDNLGQLQQLKKKHPGNISSSLKRISSAYLQFGIFKALGVMVWIGKIPLEPIHVVRNHHFYTLAILLLDGKPSNASSLIHLSSQLNELHLIEGQDYLHQVYYKLYEILSEEYLGNFCYSSIAVRTNQQYSGSIGHQPHQLITPDRSWLQIKTKIDDLHKLQISFQYLNNHSSNLIIINLQQLKPTKSIWFQKLIFISHILHDILQQQCVMKDKGGNGELDYAFICRCIEQFGGQYVNSSEFAKEILEHVNDYFKEFQKNAGKMWRPFGLMFQRGLLFLMYPLWQAGVLHHHDGHWYSQKDSENVQQYIEWSNDIVGVNYSTRQKSLPIFYRLCIQHRQFCYIEGQQQSS